MRRLGEEGVGKAIGIVNFHRDVDKGKLTVVEKLTFRA